MKGIYKGFKYTISQIFVVKEREMQIGYPTDVKHVAHIGLDGSSGNAPSWMNEFKTGTDFAASAINNNGSAFSPWSSQDFAESMRQQSSSDFLNDVSSRELPNIPTPKMQKRKKSKSKSTSSPRSNSSVSSRSSRVAKSKTKFVEGNDKPVNVEVA